MSLIKNVRFYPSPKATKQALVMCGFGGSIWQLKRLIAILTRRGYSVTALDFPEMVLSAGDVTLLPRLVREVVAFAESKAKKTSQPLLLVGVSLGALLTLNILRRSPYFSEGVLITGGDIVKVAQRLYGKNVWPQPYTELAAQWESINMYTHPKDLAGKRALFVLPANDKLIDVEDVRNEVALQLQAGNKLILIERRSFGHIGTIIEEAVLFPRRTLDYIDRLQKL